MVSCTEQTWVLCYCQSDFYIEFSSFVVRALWSGRWVGSSGSGNVLSSAVQSVVWEPPSSGATTYLISRITLRSWDTRVQRNWNSLGILVPEWLGEGGIKTNGGKGEGHSLCREPTRPLFSVILKRERTWRPRSFSVFYHLGFDSKIYFLEV